MYKKNVIILLIAIMVSSMAGCKTDNRDQSKSTKQHYAETDPKTWAQLENGSSNPIAIKTELKTQHKSEAPSETRNTPLQTTARIGTSEPIPDEKDNAEPEKIENEKQTDPALDSNNQEETNDTPQEKPSEKSNEEPQPKQQIDPKLLACLEKCNQVLANYVDDQGNVDYTRLRRKRIDLINAAREFNEFSPTQYPRFMTWTKNEKMAFWINAYNIFTLKLIIDNYPIQPHWIMRMRYPDNSIMQIPNAWEKNYFDIIGLEYTLREIERDVLLTRFEDLRVCFALSYATMSSAFLRNEPYDPNNLDRQLDDQVKKYFTSPRGLNIDKKERVVHLSSIFNMYEDFFVNSKFEKIKKFRDREPKIRAYLNFIIQYTSPEDTEFLESNSYTIKFFTYEWQLNEKSF